MISVSHYVVLHKISYKNTFSVRLNGRKADMTYTLTSSISMLFVHFDNINININIFYNLILKPDLICAKIIQSGIQWIIPRFTMFHKNIFIKLVGVSNFKTYCQIVVHLCFVYYICSSKTAARIDRFISATDVALLSVMFIAVVWNHSVHGFGINNWDI